MKYFFLICFFCFSLCSSVKAETTPIFTPEKHEDLLQKNQEYAIADRMLNMTWQIIMKEMPKQEYNVLKKEQMQWLEVGRSEMASQFAIEFTEDEAFMVSVVARTQLLSQKVWQKPETGNYVFQDNLITITKEKEKLFIQGYANPMQSFVSQVKNEKEETKNKKNKQEKEKKIDLGKQLLFRAELPQDKLWVAIKTVAEQKIYVLTIKNGLCIVHGANVFPVNFEGIYKKEK